VESPDREEGGKSGDSEEAGGWDLEMKEQGMVKRYRLVEQFEQFD